MWNFLGLWDMEISMKMKNSIMLPKLFYGIHHMYIPMWSHRGFCHDLTISSSWQKVWDEEVAISMELPCFAFTNPITIFCGASVYKKDTDFRV